MMSRAMFSAGLLLVLLTDKQPANALPSLSRPEWIWVFTHPLAAPKAWKVSRETIRICSERKGTYPLDSTLSGGNLDAFRHAYWMARLTQRIGEKRARRLGEAHEKGNYRMFLKGKLEEGMRPDSLSTVMDLQNNEWGIKIGKENPMLLPEQISEKVVGELLAGKGLRLLRSPDGHWLDCRNQPVEPSSFKGRWHIPFCLVATP
jgi:hypothetical protein